MKEDHNSGDILDDWGHRKSSAVAVVREYTTFLLIFHKTMNLLVQFSRYSKLFVEACNCFLPHVYFAPPLGMTPLEFHEDVWH